MQQKSITICDYSLHTFGDVKVYETSKGAAVSARASRPEQGRVSI